MEQRVAGRRHRTTFGLKRADQDRHRQRDAFGLIADDELEIHALDMGWRQECVEAERLEAPREIGKVLIPFAIAPGQLFELVASNCGRYGGYPGLDAEACRGKAAGRGFEFEYARYVAEQDGPLEVCVIVAQEDCRLRRPVPACRPAG